LKSTLSHYGQANPVSVPGLDLQLDPDGTLSGYGPATRPSPTSPFSEYSGRYESSNGQLVLIEEQPGKGITRFDGQFTGEDDYGTFAGR